MVIHHLVPGWLSHATEAVMNNKQGFSLSVLAGGVVCLAISLLAMGEASASSCSLTSCSSLGDDSTQLKMVAWGS